MSRERDAILRAARAAAPLFRQFEWEYESDGVRYVPDEMRLVETLTHLVESAKREGSTASSGRFSAEWDDCDGEEIVWLRLDIDLGNTTGTGDVALPEPAR